MPLYEYLCKKNGHRFEKIQSFSAEPLKECPICQGEVERLISLPNVQFKGSGFYSTDYGAKRSAPKAESAEGSNKAAASDGNTAGNTAGKETSSTAKTQSSSDSGSSGSGEKSS